jgi:hypothetical protein
MAGQEAHTIPGHTTQTHTILGHTILSHTHIQDRTHTLSRIIQWIHHMGKGVNSE